jgi:hypothetical protein
VRLQSSAGAIAAHPRKPKGAPGIKFVVSNGYSVAYATEEVLLPLKAV